MDFKSILIHSESLMYYFRNTFCVCTLRMEYINLFYWIQTFSHCCPFSSILEHFKDCLTQKRINLRERLVRSGSNWNFQPNPSLRSRDIVITHRRWIHERASRTFFSSRFMNFRIIFDHFLKFRYLDANAILFWILRVHINTSNSYEFHKWLT